MSAEVHSATKKSFTSARLFILFTRLHTWLYRLTNGLIGGRMGKNTVLLLTTAGRKSGKQFTSPLFYLADGDRFAIVASNGGAPIAPNWWQNIQANGFAHVQVGGRKLRVNATQADAQEQQRLWTKLAARYPDYDTYQRNTTRPIPVVILSPL